VYFSVLLLFCYFFFFSSRRRHTRCLSDWSSDVCSSDLSYTHPIHSSCASASALASVHRHNFFFDPILHLHEWSIHLVCQSPESKIGRASCRERVEILDGAIVVKE